jgi:hypothetical protein
MIFKVFKSLAVLVLFWSQAKLKYLEFGRGQASLLKPPGLKATEC